MKIYIPLLLLTMIFTSCKRSPCDDELYQMITDQKIAELKVQIKPADPQINYE